jgi:hypothetical protein
VNINRTGKTRDNLEQPECTVKIKFINKCGPEYQTTLKKSILHFINCVLFGRFKFLYAIARECMTEKEKGHHTFLYGTSHLIRIVGVSGIKIDLSRRLLAYLLKEGEGVRGTALSGSMTSEEGKVQYNMLSHIVFWFFIRIPLSRGIHPPPPHTLKKTRKAVVIHNKPSVMCKQIITHFVNWYCISGAAALYVW